MDALEMLAYRTEPFDFSQRATQLVQTYYGAVRGSAWIPRVHHRFCTDSLIRWLEGAQDYEGAAAMEQAEADAAADGDDNDNGMDGATEYPAWRQPPNAAT